jgi:hypothetical protein
MEVGKLYRERDSNHIMFFILKVEECFHYGNTGKIFWFLLNKNLGKSLPWTEESFNSVYEEIK